MAGQDAYFLPLRRRFRHLPARPAQILCFLCLVINLWLGCLASLGCSRLFNYRLLMTPPRIGFLAPAPLTNGYTAAVRFAAHLTGDPRGMGKLTGREMKSHADIVQAAAAGEIEYGVIAVENTLDGIIIESIRELERLFETERTRRPYICWEELLPIRHLLLNRSGRLGDVRRIASHASALRQCSRFLAAVQKALPGVEITQSLSTGQGVKEALADSAVAAMASPVPP